MNATRVRLQVAENNLVHPSIDSINFKDTIRITGEDLIDEISSAYGTCGMEGTIIVVNSNKQANRYNQGIRNRIFFREEEICPGDMVMVVKIITLLLMRMRTVQDLLQTGISPR